MQMVTVGNNAGWNPKEENRFGIMASALQLWTMYPVLGSGFGGYANFVSLEYDSKIKWPHNLLLEILCELGVVGMVPILLLLATPFVVWLRECRRPQNYVVVTLGCLWLFQFTCAMLSWDMTDNRMLFAIGAMIVANAGFRKSMDRQPFSDNIAVAPCFTGVDLSQTSKHFPVSLSPTRKSDFTHR
jgi:O-antigen ligase